MITTGTLALIIVAVIMTQLGIWGLIGWLRRKRDARVPLETATALPTENLAWTGFKAFSVQRRQMEDAQHTICSFYLVPNDGQALPPFKPGQFLTFKLQLEDPATHQIKTVVRCYSLSDRPRVDYYRISVKRVPPPAMQPQVPPGLSSNFFHEHIQAGSTLQVKAPSGHFYWSEQDTLPIVLVGGGIGITPMLSILNQVLENTISREVWLFYGVRNGGEQIMKAHLQALAQAHPNFHLYTCYSAPTADDVEDRDYQHRGRVSLDLLRTTLKLRRYQFYVCGPKALMETVVPGLLEWGVDATDIYYESFGPATLIQRDKSQTSAPCTVTFQRSGKTLAWDTNADSLLAFAEAHGIEIDSGCRAGSCGSCQTPLISGEVEYTQQADADIEAGRCLLCITKPHGDLVLDA